MKIGLFVPCYIDQFYPQVAIATLEILERLGLQVGYPLEQTCCGQPMANSGMELEAVPAMQLLIKNFADFDYIVAPSGSCVYHVRKHYDLLPQTEEVCHVRKHTYELCEFLTDVLKISDLGACFPFKTGLHQSCHGQRGLRLAQSSELVAAPFSKVKQLLEQVRGIELVNLRRPDECCGFGGTFAVAEEAVSVKMGLDRIADHIAAGAQVITGTDTSCLMHLEGLLKRQKSTVRVMHIAEILNSRL
ncbi:MAG: (Fe-S)-binding protein [Cytophagales bacterium]|nr:(Fe-S)-binding protein [Bernardetiaceae bacterium]MDW8205292.1 (Fe-S)-binding protein [Cytophagales bacterium]